MGGTGFDHPSTQSLYLAIESATEAFGTEMMSDFSCCHIFALATWWMFVEIEARSVSDDKLLSEEGTLNRLSTVVARTGMVPLLLEIYRHTVHWKQDNLSGWAECQQALQHAID